jgi:hypothetical protein
LKFKEREGSIYGTKNRLSKEELKLIKSKLESDISRVMGYSEQHKKSVSALYSSHPSPTLSPTKPSFVSSKLPEYFSITKDSLSLNLQKSMTLHRASKSQSTKAISDIKKNCKIIGKCNSLQKAFEPQREALTHHIDIVGRVFDDYQQLVEFQKE